jgi:hypothetical protein
MPSERLRLLWFQAFAMLAFAEIMLWCEMLVGTKRDRP